MANYNMGRRTFFKLMGGLIPVTSMSAALGKDIFNIINNNSNFMHENSPLQNNVKDYLFKIKNFEEDFNQDTKLDNKKLELLSSCFNRLENMQRFVGHGNFNLLSFDEFRYHAKYSSSVGKVPRIEESFLEEIFYTNASNYGFLGKKVVEQFTSKPPPREVIKIKKTGNYLFKGKPAEMYEKLRKEIGDELVLTSGIRGIVKQTYLFLKKAHETKGNLSRASRSLAPPGYSYHAVSDFDVGKKNFGARNFTSDFAETDIYKKLTDLGYVQIRYTEKNPFGVRYEPWHIKVQS